MEKIIQITINSKIFAVEEIAYLKLSEYLKEIKDTFAEVESGEEIVKDIEIRIAELLDVYGGKIITKVIVSEVIMKMGPAHMISGESQNNNTSGFDAKDENVSTKKLYRDEEDAIIGGVCAGISAYLDADPTVVRVVFILLSFFGVGIIIPIYIALWLIVPPANTVSEIAEMYSNHHKYKSIFMAIKTRIIELKEKHKFSKKVKASDVSKNESIKRDEVGSSKLERNATTLTSTIGVIIAVTIRIFLGLAITTFGVVSLVFLINQFKVLFLSGVPESFIPFVKATGSEPTLLIAVIALFFFIIIPSLMLSREGIHIIANSKRRRAGKSRLAQAMWMLSLSAIILAATHLFIDFNKYTKNLSEKTSERTSEMQYDNNVIVSPELNIGAGEDTSY